MTRNDDDPIPLAMAAADFGISKGVMMAAGRRGDLDWIMIGKTYHATPNDVRRWIATCRAKTRVRVSGSIRDESNGSSEMDRVSSARDALMNRLNGHTSF
jgi:hypothetical protein